MAYSAFTAMGLHDIIPMDSPLYGFAGDYLMPLGIISLPVTIGSHPRTATSIAEFTVVNNQNAHNVIFGCPILKEMKIATSIYHIAMRFPTAEGAGIVHGDRVKSRLLVNTAIADAEKQKMCNVVFLCGSKGKGRTWTRKAAAVA